MHQNGENGNFTGVGLGVKVKARSKESDQSQTTSLESVAVKGDRGMEMEAVRLLNMRDT